MLILEYIAMAFGDLNRQGRESREENLVLLDLIKVGFQGLRGAAHERAQLKGGKAKMA